jgi:hypothetical protein
MALNGWPDFSRSGQTSDHSARACRALRGVWQMNRCQFVATYSIRIAIACVWAASAQAIHAKTESPPYQARVVAPSAAVLSGPGDSFYPTDTLAQGDSVEVYREMPGGWLAIRPPKDSFSWLAGSDLNLKENGLAEVNADGVASRIGSRLSDKHNAAQVRLKKGEVVEIIDQQEIGGEAWYKIAPPNGEFRWINASLLERTGPMTASATESSPTSTAKPSGATTSAPAASASGVNQETQKEKPSAAADAKIETKADPKTEGKSQWQVASTAPSPGPSEFGAPPLATSASASMTPLAAGATSGISIPATPVTPPIAAPPAAANVPVPSNAVPDDLTHQLAAIELRLSRMVAAPISQWNTEKLEIDTQQLLAQAKTGPERDAVKLTLEKIQHFAEIGRRASATQPNGGQSGQAPIMPVASPAAANTPAASTTPAGADGGPYDAVGILRPVVSKRPGAPQFALVDDKGRVLSFVTPSPDLNLQPYLGRRVGITGNQGFIPEFQRAHVTAARVQPLSDRMVR